jgi:hypothetical protein
MMALRDAPSRRYGLLFIVVISSLLLSLLGVSWFASFVDREAAAGLDITVKGWEKLALKETRSARGGDLYLIGVGKADITG